MVKQKNSGHIKKFRWKIYPLILLFVITSITGILTSIVTANPVSAISSSEKQYCSENFHQKDILSTRTGSSPLTTTAEGKDFNSHHCGDSNFCTTTTHRTNLPSGGVKTDVIVAKCGTVDPSKDPSVIATAIHDGYNQIVLDKYCPSSMADQVSCITKVNEDTDKCIPSNATSAAIDFDAVAKCLEKNSPSSPKITASVIEPLLKKAQSSVQADADGAVAKAKCETDPKQVWDPSANGGKGRCLSEAEAACESSMDKTWDPKANGGKGACVATNDTAKSTCTIDGIGWIVCPVMTFMGKMVDAAYTAVSALLTVPPLDTSTNTKSNPLYAAWAVMRNLANIAFVIAFLLIIYSQITNIGVSNYGIKKLLPRIIIAAILVNVSYWICAIGVDISNILGSSVKGLFDSVTNGLAPKESTDWWSTHVSGSTGGSIVWTAGIAAVLAVGTSLIFGSLTVLLPLLIAALIAVITVVVVLTARQAIVIIFIVISPLAFVAYLLPNTEKWFKRWREVFMAMLIMFPAIAAVFGGSKLASVIIMNSAESLSGITKTIVQIMGAGVSIIPLILSPVIMKLSTGVLGKVGAFVNNPNRGPFDRMRKGAKGIAENRAVVNRGNRIGRGAGVLKGDGKLFGKTGSRRRRAAAFLTSGGGTYAVNKEKKQGFNKAVADETAQEYFAERALNEEGFAEKMAGSKAESLKASSQSAVDKLEAETIKSREVLIRSQSDPRDLLGAAGDALEKAVINGDVAGARAAQNILLNQGSKGIGVLSDRLTSVENQGLLDQHAEVSTGLRKDISAAGLKGKDNALATWSFTPGVTLQHQKENTGTYAGLTDKELLGQSEKNIAAAVRSGAVSPERADKMLKSDALQGDFNPAKRAEITKALTPQTQPADPAATTTTNVVGGGSNTLTVDHSNIPNKPASVNTTTNITTNNTTNTTETNITNKPNVNQSFPGVSTPKPSSGSVDENGRFTPGTVKDDDDYHDGMQR